MGGNARNLRLRISSTLRGDVAIGQERLSDGFSVAAIPIGFAEKFKNFLRDDLAGIVASRVVVSDSGKLDDLEEVEIKEELETVRVTGVFVGTPQDQSGYQKATKQIGDAIGVPLGLLRQNQSGTSKALQVHIFRDARTGAVDIPMEGGGFEHSLFAIRQAGVKASAKFIVGLHGVDAEVTVGNNTYFSTAGTTDPPEGIVKTIP